MIIASAAVAAIAIVTGTRLLGKRGQLNGSAIG